MATDLNNFSDEDLACRALAGSAACYEALMRRYQVPLMRFLSKRFPSRRDGEDILQETFLRAWQSLHRYDQAYAFRTWLYTIAFRLAVSRGRKMETNEEPLLTHDLRTHEESATALLERKEEKENLWTCARQVLNEEQFMALWLHYVEDVPAGDIAKILNRSWVSVKTLMHRARKKLLPHLSAEAVGAARDGKPSEPNEVSR
jgi:RNA polymerase sigma-70 factor (ECF subfamily)